jgi:preprotein translocase subunit SecF
MAMATTDKNSPKTKSSFRTADGDIDFMSLRFYFIGFSTLLTLISAIALFYPGPKLGTDFVGGTEVELAFNGKVDASTVRATVSASEFHDPEVVEVSSGALANHYMVRVKEVSTFSAEQQKKLEAALCLEHEGEETKLDATNCPEELRSNEVSFSPGGEKISVRYKQNVCAEKAAGAQPTPGRPCDPRETILHQLDKQRLASLGVAIVGIELEAGRANPVVQNVRDNKVEFYFKSTGDKIMDGLRQKLGANVVPDKALRIEWVGPKAGKQLRDAAITSVSLAMLFIMVYVAFRFDMRFAPGSVLSLLHDIFIALGAMIVARREVTLSTVAALLTVLGYSINDTVVVYDRIRENLGKHRTMSFPKLINRSITEMLGRTIKTSATTAIALVPFLFYGTGTIKDFAFTMLVGIAVGTYSSIYVAAPLTEYLDRRFFAKFGGKKGKKKRVVRRNDKPTSGPAREAGAPA